MATKNELGRNSAKSATLTTEDNVKGTSAEAQRARIIDRLKKGPLDSVDGYMVLGSLHMPRRIMELRREGHPIEMRWIYRFGPEGVPHRVGQYYLAAPSDEEAIHPVRDVDLVDMMMESADV